MSLLTYAQYETPKSSLLKLFFIRLAAQEFKKHSRLHCLLEIIYQMIETQEILDT